MAKQTAKKAAPKKPSFVKPDTSVKVKMQPGDSPKAKKGKLLEMAPGTQRQIDTPHNAKLYKVGVEGYPKSPSVERKSDADLRGKNWLPTEAFGTLETYPKAIEQKNSVGAPPKQKGPVPPDMKAKKPTPADVKKAVQLAKSEKDAKKKVKK